ncbi:MAG: P1 family peptidase [Pseudomonadota bacterium]
MSEFAIPINGVRIGHAVDTEVATGTTVCLFDTPAVTGVHIMGAAPGTRETELLDPRHTVDRVDAIVLSGGSAFGLDAAGGVQGWLKAQGRGIVLEPVRVPIVPCAILFDLRNDGNKDWGIHSPYRELGLAAVANTRSATALGKVGAAYGARTATTPGGFGAAATQLVIDGQVANIMAFAAVNAAGAPTVGDTHHYWAAPFEEDDEFGGYGFPHPWPVDAREPRTKAGQRVAGENTTLAIVVTDIELDAASANRIAVNAHDGFARALYPVHTPADGDLIFAASTGRVAIDAERLMDLGTLAANTVARAIAVGVHAALMAAQDKEADGPR